MQSYILTCTHLTNTDHYIDSILNVNVNVQLYRPTFTPYLGIHVCLWCFYASQTYVYKINAMLHWSIYTVYMYCEYSTTHSQQFDWSTLTSMQMFHEYSAFTPNGSMDQFHVHTCNRNTQGSFPNSPTDQYKIQNNALWYLSVIYNFCYRQLIKPCSHHTFTPNLYEAIYTNVDVIMSILRFRWHGEWRYQPRVRM